MNTLITQSLLEKKVGYVLSFKRELLSNMEVQWVEWIYAYILKYGVPPTLERFEKEFSTTFVSVVSPDPLRDVAEQTLVEKRNLFYRSYVTKTQSQVKDGVDPLPFAEELVKVLRSNEASCVTSRNFDKSEYFRTPESLLTGIHGLDEIIGGIVRGDLVYIAGRPGDGKTTFMLHMIANWYLQGKRILMVSNEIPWQDMLFKVDGILANMSIGEKRLGNWNKDSERKIRFLQYMQSISDGEIIIPDRPINSPSEVRGAIVEYKPDIVCIDGAYLMSPDGNPTTEWAELAEVSRELKQIANKEEVPIVGILQANRDSEYKNTLSLGALAGTDAYGQDADTVLLLKAQGVQNGDKEVMVYTSKNRNGIVSSTFVAFDFTGNIVYETTPE